MKKSFYWQKLIFVVALSMVLITTGCALADYISRIEATPNYLITLPSKLSITSTNTPTVTPENTATITPTATSTEMPTITPSPTATPCTQSSGTIQNAQVPSIALTVPMPVSVYLPPCYDPKGYYPVLYLLHGQGMTDQFWIDLGVNTIADEAIRNGQTPFIMVFPFEILNFDDNFTSKFPDAVINDLIPWVDSTYATCTERACRSIGGISRGGGWAIKLSMRNFDLFGSLGGHSYGLMYGDANWVSTNLETHSIEDFPRMYLDRGEKDSLAHDIDFFVEVLHANGLHPIFHIYPGGHTKSYWSSHVLEYMNFYMAAWPTPFERP